MLNKLPFAVNKQRKLLLLGFFCGCFLMLTALGYFQYWLALEPCPLCIMQRIVVIAISLVFLLAAIHNPTQLWRRVYAVFIGILAIFGLAIAGRHVWIQNLPPDQVPACGPGLDYMLEVFPLTQVLSMVFKGSGECAEVLWSFLGLTIPGWMLVVFSAYLVAATALWMKLKIWK